MSTAEASSFRPEPGVASSPSLGGIGLSPQGLAPQGVGLPDAAALTRLANELFAAPPGGGLSHLGRASQAQLAVPSVPHSTPPSATASLPGFGVPGLPEAQPPSAIALPFESDLAALITPGSSGLSGRSSEPSFDLVPDVPLGSGTPPSQGTLGPGPVPLPFEADLRSILASLAQESGAGQAHSSAPLPQEASGFYFLKDAPSSERGIVVPGATNGGTPAEFASSHPAFDVHAVRRDFPILKEHVNGRPLIWFDNAATTQKPKAVIDRLTYFYEHENSNIHRAAHELAARATDAYEGARNKVARFINAPSAEEIVLVRGATEAINLVAATFGATHVNEGDEIVVTHLEHHANIVPWQQLALAKGAKLRVAPVDDSGQVLLEEFGKLLNSKTKIVAFTQVSNALGTVTPAKQIVEMAHRVGATVLIDGAQSVSHMKVDVQSLGADFFVFSGHKVFAPTGIGVVWGKKEILDSLPPYQSGGNMIQDVTFERSLFHKAPQRFEAGTGNIADAVGLGAAIDYVERIGLENIARYEHGLLAYATRRVSEIPGITIIGTASEKASVLSLVIKNAPSEEVGARLNTYGIAVRSGHHCAQPILRRFGLEATVRPSFAFYNTCAEIDVLIDALWRIASERGV